MSIPLQCACGKLLQVPDEFAGKKVKCSSCFQILPVPVAGTPALRGALPWPAPSDPEEHSRAAGDSLTESRIPSTESRGGVEPGQRRPADLKRATGMMWIIGASAAVGVLLLGLVGLWVGGVFDGKTKDPVVEVNKPNPEVYMDGKPKGVMAQVSAGKVSAYEHGGTWRKEGDALVQGEDGLDRVGLIFGDPSWKDYDVTVDVQRISGTGWTWVGFRYSDWLNGFAFGTAGTQRRIIATVDGAVHLLRPVQSWASDGEWHPMSIRVEGGHIRCSMDGEKNVFTVDDDRHPRGYVALATQNLAARFRNLKVTHSDGRMLLDGVRNLDISNGKTTPVNDKVGAGSSWTGKTKMTLKGKVYPSYDAKIKILKREGTRFEGEIWSDSWRVKITGNVDPMGNITWRGTEFVIQGGLEPETLSVLVWGVVKGKQIRVYVNYSTGRLAGGFAEVTATLDE